MPDDKAFVRELIVASIGAAVVGLIYLIIEKVTKESWYAIIAVVGVAAVLLFLVMYYSQRAVADSFRKKLGLIGVHGIHANYHESTPVDQLLVQAKNNFDFLGISGRTFFESAHIEEIVRKRIKEGIVCRFLVLNPESPHLADRARSENDSPEAWKSDIRATIARIKALQKDVGSQRIMLKTYDAPPLWRAFFLDKTTAYVNYYALAQSGKDTPILVIENNAASLFNPLFGFFNYLWDNAKEE